MPRFASPTAVVGIVRKASRRVLRVGRNRVGALLLSEDGNVRTAAERGGNTSNSFEDVLGLVCQQLSLDEKGTPLNVSTTSACKPRLESGLDCVHLRQSTPEPGLDCLLCTGFARRRSVKSGFLPSVKLFSHNVLIN